MSKPTSGLYIPILNEEGKFMFSIPVKTREEISELATKMVTNTSNKEQFSFGTKDNKIFLTFKPNNNTDISASTSDNNTRNNFNRPVFIKPTYGCKKGDDCTWNFKCNFQCKNFQAGKCNYENCAFHHFINPIATVAVASTAMTSTNELV